MALERSAWADATLLFDVGRRAFRPPPKVTSSVVVLDLKAPVHDPDELRRALEIAAHALTKPRKMLSNALGSAFDAGRIEAAGLSPSMRPGTVTLEGWVSLASTFGRLE
jgi:16S rRNA (adenine1518-N6/adenine1519-N6)-dimethyltransferase